MCLDFEVSAFNVSYNKNGRVVAMSYCIISVFYAGN